MRKNLVNVNDLRNVNGGTNITKAEGINGFARPIYNKSINLSAKTAILNSDTDGEFKECLTGKTKKRATTSIACVI